MWIEKELPEQYSFKKTLQQQFLRLCVLAIKSQTNCDEFWTNRPAHLVIRKGNINGPVF